MGNPVTYNRWANTIQEVVLDKVSSTHVVPPPTRTWKSLYKWSSKVTNEKHLVKFKSEGIYQANMTYRQAYLSRMPEIAKRYVDANTYEDCANFTFYPLVEFAHYYKLPLYFEDYRAKSNYKIISNNRSDFSDWKEMRKQLGLNYSASSMYSDYCKFLITANSKESITSGTLFTWAYYVWFYQDNEDRNYHVSTCYQITSDTIKVVQGSLDDGKPTLVAYKEYSKDEDNKPDYGMFSWIKEVKAKNWNFEIFDAHF